MSSLEIVAKGIFDLKNQFEEGRVSISHKIYEAQEFVKRHSYEKYRTFSNIDIAILTEAKELLAKGKEIFIIAYADKQQYDLYHKIW